jgi:hypothetical protein
MKMMDKTLSSKDQKMLIRALERAKEESRKMEAKEEEKRWAEIDLPIALADIFVNLTKSELSDIRMNLDIKGISGLKKQELIAALEQQIPEALPALLYTFDETRYKIMKQIADRGGHAFMPLETEQLQYFKERGLLFSGTNKGKKTLAIPQEVLACFQETDKVSYRETVRRNEEWIKLTQGALFYYGTLSLVDLEKILHQHTGSQVSLHDYLIVLEESVPFYREIKIGKEGFSNIRVWDPSRVKKEHQLRSSVSWYSFTKKQLLQAGEPNFVDRHPIYQGFVDFIRTNYPLSRNEVDQLVEECVYAIQIGEPESNIIQFLQQRVEIDEIELVQTFMDHIVNLHNNTKQWFLKGYSPKELSAARNKTIPLTSAQTKTNVVDLFSKKTIGRNDPCPCGSGKKFKKCCGK